MAQGTANWIEMQGNESANKKPIKMVVTKKTAAKKKVEPKVKTKTKSKTKAKKKK